MKTFIDKAGLVILATETEISFRDNFTRYPSRAKLTKELRQFLKDL